MTFDDAKKRIETAVTQYGLHAGPAIELVMNEVRFDLGAKAYNVLVDELDLELEYNIAPLESDISSA